MRRQPQRNHKTQLRHGGTELVVVGGLIVVLAVAGVIWYLSTRNSPKDDNNPKDKPAPEKTGAASTASLDLVPADAPAFGTVALAKWWNSDQGKQFQQQIAEVEPSPQIEKVLGLPPEKIERLTLALPKTGTPVIIVASSSPYDQKRVISMVALGAEEQKDGASVHRSNGGSSVHFVNDKVYVFGPEKGIKDYLSRTLKTGALGDGPLKEAAGLAEKHMAVAAVDPQFGLFRNLPQAAADSPLGKALRPVFDLRFAHLTLDLGDQLDLNAQLSYADGTTAKKNLPAIKAVLDLGRSMLANLRKGIDPSMREAAAPFVNFLDSIMRSAAVEQQEEKVRVVVQSEKGSLGLLVAALGPAVQKVRDAANRATSQNNLKQIALGIISSADIHQGQMPTAAIYSKVNGQPLLSWRVAILPFIEQEPLYKQFKLDEPWDSEHNKKLIPMMPKTYAPPTGGQREPYSTYYRVFTGPMTPFPGPVPLRYPLGFSDGTSNTILVVEAGEAVTWTRPDELVYAPNKPLPKLGGMFKDLFNVVLADGSVRSLTPKVSEKTIRAAITPAGNEVMGDDW